MISISVLVLVLKCSLGLDLGLGVWSLSPGFVDPTQVLTTSVILQQLKRKTNASVVNMKHLVILSLAERLDLSLYRTLT